VTLAAVRAVHFNDSRRLPSEVGDPNEQPSLRRTAEEADPAPGRREVILGSIVRLSMAVPLPHSFSSGFVHRKKSQAGHHFNSSPRRVERTIAFW
jgi:hypothetical protein